MNDVEARIIKLENSYNSLKEKIEDIKNSLNNSLERLFISIEKVQKSIESFNHITLKQTIQEQALTTLEKNFTILQAKAEQLEKQFQEHDIKQKTSLKIIAILFTSINTLIMLIGKIYGK